MITIKDQVNVKWNCRSPAPAGDFAELVKGFNRSQGQAPT